MHIFEEVVAIKKRNQNGHCVNCLLSYLNRLYCEYCYKKAESKRSLCKLLIKLSQPSLL